MLFKTSMYDTSPSAKLPNPNLSRQANRIESYPMKQASTIQIKSNTETSAGDGESSIARRLEVKLSGMRRPHP